MDDKHFYLGNEIKIFYSEKTNFGSLFKRFVSKQPFFNPEDYSAKTVRENFIQFS